ncbi:hypothetical protein JKP88DRAFT_348334 [Tribonema minus]|uniref:Uncharacterized protein n=1 Tax=Tribonema minus TaxID=303371 RepID=A0A835Z2T4_9STRA|nr:hypothetical protein JKP88DRAFT_348334 [Tribonema minus]
MPNRAGKERSRSLEEEPLDSADEGPLLLRKGFSVKVLKTENTTARFPYLIGCQGVIQDVPQHPNTWYKVQVDNRIYTLRPSALELVDEGGEAGDEPGDTTAVAPNADTEQAGAAGARDADKMAISPSNNARRRSQAHGDDAPSSAEDPAKRPMRDAAREKDPLAAPKDRPQRPRSSASGSGGGGGSAADRERSPGSTGGASSMGDRDDRERGGGGSGGGDGAGGEVAQHTLESAMEAVKAGVDVPLTAIDTELWPGCFVKILAGKLKGKVGKVLRSGNGWVNLMTQLGEKATRAGDLLLALEQPAKRTGHASGSDDDDDESFADRQEAELDAGPGGGGGSGGTSGGAGGGGGGGGGRIGRGGGGESSRHHPRRRSRATPVDDADTEEAAFEGGGGATKAEARALGGAGHKVSPKRGSTAAAAWDADERDKRDKGADGAARSKEPRLPQRDARREDRRAAQLRRGHDDDGGGGGGEERGGGMERDDAPAGLPNRGRDRAAAARAARAAAAAARSSQPTPMEEDADDAAATAALASMPSGGSGLGAAAAAAAAARAEREREQYREVARRQWDVQIQRGRERPNLTHWRDQIDASAREPDQDPEAVDLNFDLMPLRCCVCYVEKPDGDRFCWNSECLASPIFEEFVKPIPGVPSASLVKEDHKDASKGFGGGDKSVGVKKDPDAMDTDEGAPRAQRSGSLTTKGEEGDEEKKLPYENTFKRTTLVDDALAYVLHAPVKWLEAKRRKGTPFESFSLASPALYRWQCWASLEDDPAVSDVDYESGELL